MQQAKLERIVDRFNLCFPVGSKVLLQKDSGEVETEVAAPAQILGGHSAVAWFADVSGCYDISTSRVWPRVDHLGIDPDITISPISDDAGFAVCMDLNNKYRVDVYPPNVDQNKGTFISIQEPELTASQARNFARLLKAAAAFADALGER